ncbi:hypothetical protein BJ741DRAFT_708317 [Chytriomyces cf. hyalinus JEL632]|nr:hypothetical protein BJ741DRAFT_708317 [Chytriomyces cf. hyalinus JEL632]
MHYDMILGLDPIALSIHHAHDFSASDRVPVILNICLSSLKVDVSHLMYDDDSVFGDVESDVVSEDRFHSCLRCGTIKLSMGSTECLRCTARLSENSLGFDSEEESLESLHLRCAVQGLFEDEYLYSDSDEGSFNGFETTTETESSSRDSGGVKPDEWQGDSLGVKVSPPPVCLTDEQLEALFTCCHTFPGFLTGTKIKFAKLRICTYDGAFAFDLNEQGCLKEEKF